MGERVTVDIKDAVATITLDDGKMNALKAETFGAINAALDQAAKAGAVVILTGREGAFSGGFDLRVLGAGGPDAVTMLTMGFELGARLLAHPTPVVMRATRATRNPMHSAKYLT